VVVAGHSPLFGQGLPTATRAAVTGGMRGLRDNAAPAPGLAAEAWADTATVSSPAVGGGHRTVGPIRGNGRPGRGGRTEPPSTWRGNRSARGRPGLRAHGQPSRPAGTCGFRVPLSRPPRQGLQPGRTGAAPAHRHRLALRAACTPGAEGETLAEVRVPAGCAAPPRQGWMVAAPPPDAGDTRVAVVGQALPQAVSRQHSARRARTAARQGRCFLPGWIGDEHLAREPAPNARPLVGA
jgi:hypothetical protein